MAQTPKKRIDIGTVGNASTGDILYDGGEKINSNFDELYNTFGDRRRFDTDKGVGRQTLHATGYYQKRPRSEYAGSPVELGSMHDIDTSTGTLSLILPKGKAGEGIEIINSNGSFSVANALNIRPQSGDAILGHQSSANITQPYSRVIVWCVSVQGNKSTWRIGIESMFTDTTTPLDKTVQVTQTATNVAICGKNEYNTVKLITSATNTAGTKIRSSETLLMIDAKAGNVYSTEYAALEHGGEMYTVKYFIGAGEVVYAEFTAIGENIRIAVKAVDTVKIGAAV